MSELTRPNTELEAALAGVTDANQVREVTLRVMASQGTIVRTRDDEFREIRQQSPEATLPTSNYKFEREVRFHPESGKRTLLIRGNSQSDLDALEKQLTGETR
jgi:hypothetical protein